MWRGDTVHVLLPRRTTIPLASRFFRDAGMASKSASPRPFFSPAVGRILTATSLKLSPGTAYSTPICTSTCLMIHTLLDQTRTHCAPLHNSNQESILGLHDGVGTRRDLRACSVHADTYRKAHAKTRLDSPPSQR